MSPFLLLLCCAIPVPDAAEIRSAEKLLQEAFDNEPQGKDQQAERAAKMLEVAAGEPSAANRYVLLTHARRLGVAAGDSALAMEAVEGLARFDGPSDPSQGHRLWAQARDLDGKMQAVEIYLRMLQDDKLPSLHRSAAEERVREVRGKYLDPAGSLEAFRRLLLGKSWYLYWDNRRDSLFPFRFLPDGRTQHANASRTKDWPKTWRVERRWCVVTDANVLLVLPNGELRGFFLGTGQPVGAYPEKR